MRSVEGAVGVGGFFFSHQKRLRLRRPPDGRVWAVEIVLEHACDKDSYEKKKNVFYVCGGCLGRSLAHKAQACISLLYVGNG